MDERLIASIGIRAALLVAASVNLRLAARERAHYRDVRGLRGFVAAITMFAGVIAFSAGSPTIAGAIPGATSLFAVITGAGVAVFLAGIIFSVYSWKVPRDEARK